MRAEAAFPDAASLGLQRIVHLPSVTSTMDVAHGLAENGAPDGTAVVADVQTAGRGRGGNVWDSQHRGLWLTLLYRPKSAASLELLSLRTGLAIAAVLEQLDTDGIPFRLKWPNDVFKGERKVAGVLVEARWREQAIEWIAVGIGINLLVPQGVPSAAVSPNVSRAHLLQRLVPAMRTAAIGDGILSPHELSQWAVRDLARDREITAPVVGVARGISAIGALIVETSAGARVECRSGSLVFAG